MIIWKKTRPKCKCFHCGCGNVVWEQDIEFDDLGMNGKGIIHICHCDNCGARIEYQATSQGHDGIPGDTIYGTQRRRYNIDDQ